ncbi:integrase [Herbaspirillum sp. B65]|uniref:integrase n=1 Tax=Herbaspirillum sp. B65 TaxID=137708 RepID=UPI00034BF193|nr:integrase [Herbaspirillum sp. B65]
MIRTLLIHDRLADPKNHQHYLEVVDPHLHGGCIKVFDPEKKEDCYVEMTKVSEEIYNGTMTVLRKGKPLVSLVAQPFDESLRKKDSFIRQVMRTVKDNQKLGKISFLEACRQTKEEYETAATATSPAFPALATLYRYHQLEMRGLPLIRGAKNKGNRTKRYPQKVIDVICQLAREHYLQPHSLWSIKKIAEKADRSVRGSLLPEDAPPISTRFVKNTIHRLVHVDPSAARMLPKDAIAGKSVARKRIRAEQPLERVEQDAVHLPFVVRTPGGISSQVHLVHAIDCCTGLPLGWCLVVGAPTDSDSLACIEMYMTPDARARRLKKLDLSYNILAYGTPAQLLFDNGAENQGGRIMNLQKLYVDTKHCRARAGQEKPFIERLHGSLKEDIETLPGCTRLDGEDGLRDPLALGDELMDIDELERWIVRWYYEKWGNHQLDRLLWETVLDSNVEGATPLARLAYFEESCVPIALPPSRADWLSALYEQVERKLSRKTGVTIDGLHYKGEDFGTLIDKYGEQQFLTIVFNPDDFRYVYVREGDDQPLVKLEFEYLKPETPAWSFREAKERYAKAKRSTSQIPGADKFSQELQDRSSQGKRSASAKNPSKRERNRETKDRTREINAIKRAAIPKSPMLSAQSAKSQKSVEQIQLETAMLEPTPLLTVLNRDSGDEI